MFTLRADWVPQRAARVVAPVLAVLTVLAMLFPPTAADDALAAGSITLPFQGGTAAKIIQGYSGGTHQGRSQFALDIVLANGGTSGAPVVSPAEGTITFAQPPNGAHGCIEVATSTGTHTVMLCHVSLNRTYARGESIARGQTLGTIGAPGTVGNNGVAHIHLELHDAQSNVTVPFAEPDGLALEGIALPRGSTTAVVSLRGPIVSSNRPGSGPAPSTTLAQSGERTVPMSTASEPAPVAAASVPSTTRSVPGTSSGPATSSATRRAVVQGTDSCLKVHKQPTTDSAVVGCLTDGSEIALKPLASGADARWRQTDKGWVSSEYLKRTQAVVAGTGTCLNVREAAKTDAAKLGCLPEGTSVTIADGPTSADGFAWYRIEPAGSLDKGGWVVGKYLD